VCEKKRMMKECDACLREMCGECLRTTHKETCEERRPEVAPEVAPEVVPEVAPEVVPDEYAEYGGGALLAIEDDHSSSGSSSGSSSDSEDDEDDEDNGEDDDAYGEVALGVRSVVSKNANDRAKGIKVAAKGVRMNQEIADRIRERHDVNGESILAIAEDIGFHPCAVRRVVRKETWVVKTQEVGADGRVRIVAVAPTAAETAERKAKKTAPKAKKAKTEGSGEKRTREFYKTRVAELEAENARLRADLEKSQRLVLQQATSAEMAENIRRSLVARVAELEDKEDAEAQAAYDGE